MNASTAVATGANAGANKEGRRKEGVMEDLSFGVGRTGTKGAREQAGRQAGIDGDT